MSPPYKMFACYVHMILWYNASFHPIWGLYYQTSRVKSWIFFSTQVRTPKLCDGSTLLVFLFCGMFIFIRTSNIAINIRRRVSVRKEEQYNESASTAYRTLERFSLTEDHHGVRYRLLCGWMQTVIVNTVTAKIRRESERERLLNQILRPLGAGDRLASNTR